MKMHPKPMIRHTWPVIECAMNVQAVPDTDKIHIVLTMDGRTQRIVMNRDEATRLARGLRTCDDLLNDGVLDSVVIA
jgi:hypothetical protein